MQLHPHVPHPSSTITNTVSDRIADRIAAVFGSMRMFYGLVCWQLGWIVLATLGVSFFKNDQYPFVFCLFLSNLIQLWALPVLGVATNRADEKRSAKADADHQALTHLASVVDEIRAAVVKPPKTVVKQAGKTSTPR